MNATLSPPQMEGNGRCTPGQGRGCCTGRSHSAAPRPVAPISGFSSGTGWVWFCRLMTVQGGYRGSSLEG
ncbi:hypothetical protein BJY00DRAFT_293637 [Aspergillus carlsbadensis]|nr:hypothetical protein BJY00DRAFT_293637 [Aspergillus carlsbadensis]